MGRLQGKVAIVTGAGQGIGKAYAGRFLDEGARVVIADYSPERGEAALAELQGRGEVVFFPTDISQEGSAEDCARRTVERFGTVDVLVNNAALYYDIDNTDNSPDYLKRVFDVNLHGAWLMSRAVTPTMCANRWGRIINQSSGAAYIYQMPPEPKFGELSAFSYSQTKWGLVGLTKFMAGQLGQFNVLVNCIAPGVTMTEATRKIVPEDMMGLVTMMSAMKRTLEPEDLTGAAVFFASDDANFVTGQVLCVDGGASMPA
jgi:3-oxoacyl-[acyl-carrier protein] reductase